VLGSDVFSRVNGAVGQLKGCDAEPDIRVLVDDAVSVDLPAAAYLTWCHSGEATGVSAAEDVFQGRGGGGRFSPGLELGGVRARLNALTDVVGDRETARGEKPEKHVCLSFGPAPRFAFGPGVLSGPITIGFNTKPG
jgi:hypothetical protein